MIDLSGRVAIVTGAAGGLGASICDVFRRSGAEVVAVDLAGDGILRADVATDEGNRRAVEEALARHGRLDTLVLNAGVQHMAPIAEFPEAEWDRLMGVMAKGPFLTMKHAWRHLTARPGGRIVVTASGSSFFGEAYKSAYVAAKHAVAGLVKVAALEGGEAGLTANAVAPGWMRTPLVERQLADQMRLNGLSREEVIPTMVQRHGVKRFVETEEVALLIAFLASDLSSGMTGSIVPVDLGAAAC
jgi:3-hydroxybutyrate dehydrogenase